MYLRMDFMEAVLFGVDFKRSVDGLDVVVSPDAGEEWDYYPWTSGRLNAALPAHLSKALSPLFLAVETLSPGEAPRIGNATPSVAQLLLDHLAGDRGYDYLADRFPEEFAEVARAELNLSSAASADDAVLAHCDRERDRTAPARAETAEEFDRRYFAVSDKSGAEARARVTAAYWAKHFGR